MMIYDVNYFIDKFSKIPENLWCINSRDDGHGRRCAHGWCDINNYGDEMFTKEELALHQVFKPLCNGGGCAYINNGGDKRYPQPTPKQRILAALYDIKKMQEPIPKQTIRYVTVVVDKKISDMIMIEN